MNAQEIANEINALKGNVTATVWTKGNLLRVYLNAGRRSDSYITINEDGTPNMGKVCAGVQQQLFKKLSFF